jgi:sulfate/thiosulfate transport system permease protein
MGRARHAHGARMTMRWRPTLIVIAWAYVGAVILMPLLLLVVEAARTGVGTVARELTSRDALGALGLTLAVALLAIVVNTVFGIGAGIVLERHRFRGRRVLDALVDLPLSVSPVMIGLAMLLLFGRAGWLFPAVESMGVQVAFAVPGVILCTLFVTLPFTVREVGYVLAEIGTDEEQVASTLGASAWQTFRRVTLPNIQTAMRLGIVLTAARAFGEFGAVLVVGGAIAGRTQTATTFIYAAMEERRRAAALGMALVLAALSMVLLAVLMRLRGGHPHTEARQS